MILHDQNQLRSQLSMIYCSTVTHKSSWSSGSDPAVSGGPSAVNSKLRAKLAPSCLNLTGGLAIRTLFDIVKTMILLVAFTIL